MNTMKAMRPTLGILAGGAATRLGGRDKAWLQCAGRPRVLALAEGFAGRVARVLVSANRELPRYAAHGLTVVRDRVAGIGPLGGLEALAAACDGEWLLTVPVDALRLPEDLPAALAASPQGAFAEDDDGVQPLVALWPLAPLRRALPPAIAERDYAIRALQARLRMPAVRFAGQRFGNLNTPADLAAAGIELR